MEDSTLVSVIYQYFQVDFNYQCQDDTFSLTGLGEQVFTLGDADKTISLGMTQSRTLCAST